MARKHDDIAATDDRREREREREFLHVHFLPPAKSYRDRSKQALYSKMNKIAPVKRAVNHSAISWRYRL